MKKILITGAAGLLGQHLVKRLRDDCLILAVDIKENPFKHPDNLNFLKADLTDFSSIRSKLVSFAPDIIFNCAALTDVDRCEDDKKLAEKLNYELVNHLLGLPLGKFVHFSSDYVFDGLSGPYSEDDPTDPVNFYGTTKLHSENILLNSGVNHLIIRTNVLYGNAVNVKTDFVSWVKDNLERNEYIKAVDNQFNNPISARNLAEAAVEAAFADVAGILHIAGADYLSRYETAVKIANYFNLDLSLIIKSTTDQLPQKARRPHYGGLKISKAKSILKTRLLGLHAGLDDIKQA